MINNLKLIFTSFYNIKAGNEFAKSGKGVGNGMFFIIALVFCSIFVAGIYAKAGNVFDREVLLKQANETVAKLPKIVIKDGELQWKDGEIKSFVVFEEEGAKGKEGTDAWQALMTIDTVNDEPKLSQLQESTIYLTKTDLYVYNNKKGELRSVALKDIQTLMGKNPIDLTSEEVVTKVVDFARYAIWGVAGFVVVFCVLGFWIAGVFLTFLVRVFSSTFNAKFKEMEYSAVRRLAAVSTVPGLVALKLIDITTGELTLLIRWAAVVIIGVVVMMVRKPQD